MLKIHQHFFKNFIFVFLAILVGTAISSYFWVKSIYIEQTEKNLSQNIDSLSSSLTDLTNISTIVKSIKKNTGLRITIINKNGDVLEDSDKNRLNMENHKNRVEIIEANLHGTGKSIRFSQSVKKDLLYVAKKVTINKEIIFIRMSDYIDLLQEKFLKLSIQITSIFSFFFIIALFFSYKSSKKIEQETNNILKFLGKINNKEYSSRISSNYSKEFNDITNLLNEVNSTLQKREKQKRKYTSKLKYSNRQKDEIISAISHEFKNPIAIISGYSETILSDKDLPLQMKEKFLNKIYSTSNKMSNLIDRLRLSIKLEKSDYNLEYTTQPALKIINEIVFDLELKYPNRKIIVLGIDKDLKIDETLFSIAIENLIENALKYSQSDVTVELSNNKIEIKDKGIGIDSQELEKISAKFYRVSSNEWNNSLGLGLFIVNKILEMHKFNLKIDSKVNQGSIFSIFF